jgi:hypothetical protein
MQPHTARHFESLKLLKTLNPDSMAYILGSRDLVFQTSPLDLSLQLQKISDLHFFDESGLYFKDGNPQITKYSKANSTWARQLLNYDEKSAGVLDDKVIINADCIYGKVSSLCDFLEQSCNLLALSKHSAYGLLDQASTNYVAHEMIEHSLAVLHTNGSKVLNMCGVVSEFQEIIDGKLTLNSQVVPIVHQFDRYGVWFADTGFDFNKRSYKVQI